MNVSTCWGTARIDESFSIPGRLFLEQQVDRMSTRGPKPDPAWTFVDSNRHFHARSGDSWPRLRSKEVKVPCDGSCGGVCEGQGYGRTEWSCRICGEVIEPGLIPGPHDIFVPGPKSWRVEVEGFAAGVPAFDVREVSIRFDADGPQEGGFFGVASVSGSEFTSSGSGLWLKADYHGISELGVLKSAKAAVG